METKYLINGIFEWLNAKSLGCQYPSLELANDNHEIPDLIKYFAIQHDLICELSGNGWAQLFWFIQPNWLTYINSAERAYLYFEEPEKAKVIAELRELFLENEADLLEAKAKCIDELSSIKQFDLFVERSVSSAPYFLSSLIISLEKLESILKENSKEISCHISSQPFELA